MSQPDSIGRVRSAASSDGSTYTCWSSQQLLITACIWTSLCSPGLKAVQGQGPLTSTYSQTAWPVRPGGLARSCLPEAVVWDLLPHYFISPLIRWPNSSITVARFSSSGYFIASSPVFNLLYILPLDRFVPSPCHLVIWMKSHMLLCSN